MEKLSEIQEELQILNDLQLEKNKLLLKIDDWKMKNKQRRII